MDVNCRPQAIIMGGIAQAITSAAIQQMGEVLARILVAEIGLLQRGVYMPRWQWNFRPQIALSPFGIHHNEPRLAAGAKRRANFGDPRQRITDFQIALPDA